jgi:heme-binding protein
LRNRLPAVLIVGAGLLAAISAFVHPLGMVKAQSYEMPLFVGAQIDPDVLQIFERSCQNCHSERTDWPWYSYIAPIGWFIEKDVQQGREHMDLSQWDRYARASQRDILTRMSAVLRSRQMPLPRYLILHPGSKLSEADIAMIDEWTQKERLRLKAMQ